MVFYLIQDFCVPWWKVFVALKFLLCDLVPFEREEREREGGIFLPVF